MTEHMALLLRLIHAKADVHALRVQGLEYAQITQLVVEASKTDLIERTSEGYQLTRAGIAALMERGTSTGTTVRGGWIGPAIERRVDKLTPDEVYLPVRRHSFFRH